MLPPVEIWCPQLASNQPPRIFSPVLIPLSYRGVCGASGRSRTRRPSGFVDQCPSAWLQTHIWHDRVESNHRPSTFGGSCLSVWLRSYLAPPAGIEPAAFGLGNLCRPSWRYLVPQAWNRTRYRLLTRQVLILMSFKGKSGTPTVDRTQSGWLKANCSTLEL